MHEGLRRGLLALGAAGMLATAGTGTAAAADTTLELRTPASDGVSLKVTVTGEAPLSARPTLVEFTPYGPTGTSLKPGAGYNRALVQIRGTGASDGTFDALGTRTQKDVAEVLAWACRQPWSDGRLALAGFSASAITVYNSLHQTLPCVKAAVLKSGTFDLYRDLFYPGGVLNLVPGLAVIAGIGAPGAQQAGNRTTSLLDAFGALVNAGFDGLRHSTLDSWWQERRFRGDVNRLPILMVNGIFDVESRGAFEAYKALKSDKTHLYVVGAHDAAPAGTDAGYGESVAWLDHWVRGVDNGVERHPRVQLWLADGDREDFTAGRYVKVDAADWPVPGTRWQSLALDPKRARSARTLNDGTLSTTAPAQASTQTYLSQASFATMTDLPNAAVIGAAGLNSLTTAFPALSDMTLAEPLGLSYTTPPLTTDLVAAGPASLELKLATLAPSTVVWAVISDVDTGGTPHPVAVGRLSSDFPGVDAAKSLKDATGAIVQPYGIYDPKSPAPFGASRQYRVEFWPIGNRFKAGHRIRLHLLGASNVSAPVVPTINTVGLGGAQPSRLLLPVLP